jgi:thiol-disulfide isomerase/thioredoxin
MSEQSAMKRGGMLKRALWGAALVGVAAVVYITAKSSTMPHSAQPPAKAVATSQGDNVGAKLEHPADGKPGPTAAFDGPDGKPVKLADFKGKVVVFNSWATWCAPCKIEMPTLAKLQAQYAGQPVAVVAVSIDSATDLDKAKAFIGQNAPLAFYHDKEMKLPFKLEPIAVGMPTTVIYGKDGLERGRVSGEADWSSASAKKIIDKALAEG